MDNLPRFFALESLSNNKYLRYVHEEDVVLHRHLEINGEEVISLYTKFELEPAKTEGNKGLFNIRCCYNNKYWTRNEENTRWITATAAKPVEDQFKWSCTLFQPSIQVSKDGKSTVRLRHAQHGHYVPVSIGSGGGDPPYRSCLKADANTSTPSHQDSDDTSSSSFSIIDWESFVILPKLVAFNHNGLYLGFKQEPRSLIFQSSDISWAGTSNQVLYTRDGSVRLRVHVGGNSLPWYTVPNSYFMEVASALTTVPADGMDLFWLFKGRGDNEVAIWNKKATLFCHMDTRPFKNAEYLMVETKSMVKEAIMRVEEPVVSRTVYNVDFRLEDARIYHQYDAVLVRRQFSNPLDVDEVTHLTQTLTKETTRTWNSIVTLKLRTPGTIETSIPSIVDDEEVDFTDEFEGRYEWGTDMKGSETTEFSDHINIPPRSIVMVHVIATKAKCDVPFSYMQRDIGTDGKVYINKMDDGVFTGTNYYNFKAQVVKTTPMPKKN